MLTYREAERMGNDKFHTDAKPLSFSTEAITLLLTPGEVREGSFTIYGQPGTSVDGFVTSSKFSMQCLTETFAGSRDTITYRFDASNLSAGETVEGFFRIFSNHGEYKIPYGVKIMPEQIDSTLGPVRNLYHFTNLAKTNWNEACDVFYSPAFSGVFTVEEKKEAFLYRVLSADPGNMQNMEEFLIATGKKEKVTFAAQEKELTADVPLPEKEIAPLPLTIRRNGWGYTRLSVTLEGDFLFTQEDELDAAAFAQGSYTLCVQVDEEKLHAGVNLGTVILTSPFDEIRVPVQVRYCVDAALRTIHHRKEKKLLLSLMQDYEKLRARKMSGRDFTKKAGETIRQLREIDRNSTVFALYRIHYLLTDHNPEEALWELGQLCAYFSDNAEDLNPYDSRRYDFEEDVEYAYRMYLTILCAESTVSDDAQVEQITRDAVYGIEQTGKQNPDSFWITWLLMYASGEYRRRPAECYDALYGQFEKGSRSPILYIEAYQLLMMDPSICHDLDDFSLQVLWYAARQEILTEAVMTQVGFLAKRSRSFNERLLKIMERAYHMTSLESVRADILEGICSLLIRGNVTDGRCFEWYRQGVAYGLTITRLFEYYMMTLPEDYDGEIPRMVIMYFAYQSTLPYQRSAYLYRYVLEHEDEYAQIMDQYEPQITAFTIEQIRAGKMNRDLAVLYARYFASDIAMETETAQAALKAAFAVHIKEGDWQKTGKGTLTAVVAYERTLTETRHSLYGAFRCFPVFGDESVVFLEDKQKNRYIKSLPFETERMMDGEKLTKVLNLYDVDDFLFNVYRTSKETIWPITSENRGVYQKLAESDELTKDAKAELRARLFAWCRDAQDKRELEQFLMGLEPDEMGVEERSQMIRQLTERGMYRKAFTWVMRYGSFGVEGKTQLKLVSGILSEEKIEEDAHFLEIAHETYLKGRYDQNLLQYLMTFFDGLTSELEEIRQTALRFGTDTWSLCKRMLIQMLYTGKIIPEREEIIETFMAQDHDARLLSSVIAQSCHAYFVEEAKISDFQFDLVRDYGREGVPMVDICRIAWLKNASEKSGGLSDEELEVTALFLGDLMDEGLVFPFYRQFIGVLPQLQSFADETLVEYRTKKGGGGEKILYHYALEKDGQRGQYEVRRMKEMYEGVFVTGFCLFFGEQMHYYITDDDAEKNVVESGTLGQDARIPEGSEDRFGMINQISMLMALGRDTEALALINLYTRRAFLTQNIFQEGEKEEKK